MSRKKKAWEIIRFRNKRDECCFERTGWDRTPLERVVEVDLWPALVDLKQFLYGAGFRRDHGGDS